MAKGSREKGVSKLTSSATKPVTVTRVIYRGWNCYCLSNGLLKLILAPAIGGRVIQLCLGEQELFFVHPAFAGKILSEHQNSAQVGCADYGGDKVWPAPEGWASDNEWPGVPYYPLDGARFKVQVVKSTPN